MAATRRKDRKKFLEYLNRSRLLTPEQYAEAVAGLPDTDRALAVARHLVGCGALTKFQAEMLLIGRTNGFFLGQYRILDEIGCGGMGRVFKAVHETMARIVALKVLPNELLQDARARQLFQREVRALACLIHPNIVTAYDANQSGDRCYLVMEFVDGPNLEQLVREQGPLPVGQACDFIRQAALGLQFAFEKGMVHRDIKPANLLVQRGGDGRCAVKILDFGLARLQSSTAVNGSKDLTIAAEANRVVGTPDYIAPEQAENVHAADIRSDLYSLGCTLYFLLTGKVPFGGTTLLEKIIKHSAEPPPVIEAERPEVPKEVGAILRKLLAKAPAERYQTPAELAAVLAPFAVAGPPLWEPHPERSSEPEERSGDVELVEAMTGTLPAVDATLKEGVVGRTRYRLARPSVVIAVGCGLLVGAIALLLVWLAQ
jgi:serine/threonine-protein kinase